MAFIPTYGVFSSDVVIRAAIVQGLRELRANPWLLDYCFSWLMYDDLTNQEYGKKEIDEAKKWFLSTPVEVRMSTLSDSPVFPLISIHLSESVEDQSSLGDVHYHPISDATPHIVGTGPNIQTFTPTSYDPDTGIITHTGTIKALVGQTLLDTHNNTGYEILEVSSKSFKIEPNCIGVDFRNAQIVPRFDTKHVHLESLMFRETYTMGVHASGHQRYALYLHSILVFIMLRWKEVYLERRGFERSTLASGPLSENENFAGGPEVVFSRTVQTTGYIRQYWPKLVTDRAESTEVTIYDSSGNTLSTTECPIPDGCDQPF